MLHILQLFARVEPWKVAKSNSNALIWSGCRSCPSLLCWKITDKPTHDLDCYKINIIWCNVMLLLLSSINVNKRYHKLLFQRSIEAKRRKITSARKISIANPLKQLMTACWTSKPRPSKVLIVESKRPGRRPQNMWMLTALPSLNLTSICETNK